MALIHCFLYFFTNYANFREVVWRQSKFRVFFGVGFDEVHFLYQLVLTFLVSFFDAFIIFIEFLLVIFFSLVELINFLTVLLTQLLHLYLHSIVVEGDVR